MIDVKITNGAGDSTPAKVDKYNSIKVNISEPEIPETGTQNRKRFFSETVSGMNVDGSVTSQTFDLTSDATNNYDIKINNIVLVLSDSAINPKNYGNVSPLTNGVDLLVKEGGDTTYLVEKAKTGGNLLAQSGLPSPFGSGTGVNVLSNWSTNDDALVVTWDITQIMGGQGIRLGRGIRDKICFCVNDDLTGLVEHFIIFQGYKLYE